MLRLRLFGNPTVLDGDTPLAGAAAQPRRLALLALLATAEGGLSREKLIGILWPDVEEDRARRNLTHALYALRRDLGDEEALQGAKDLRLDPARIGSDVADFTAALAEGRVAEAVGRYGGPFLDGFHLPGVDEFERWMEAQRTAYTHQYAEALESLAARTVKAGQHRDAVQWWRRLGALDPLNARYCVGLMESLAASGDVAAALRHARVFEALVGQELAMAPDPRVLAAAERLRAAPPTAAPAAGVAPQASPAPTAPSPSAPEAPVQPEPDASPPAPRPGPVAERIASGRRVPPGQRLLLGGLAALLLLAAVVGVRQLAGRRAPGIAVLAVGGIADRRPAGSDPLTDALTDMLATNLARSQAIRVVSNARLLQLAGDRAADVRTYLSAASRAGAGELVEGALYALPDGRLRLDLRRVGVRGGDVRQALTVEGADPFALADSGTARILASLGAAGLAGSVADVTTRSLAAWQLYRTGMRMIEEYWQVGRAALFFKEALEVDSTFALAAYHYAMTDQQLDTPSRAAALRRAVRLAEHATPHDRLLIKTSWAQHDRSPDLLLYADSLVRLFPQEVTGHKALGAAYTWEGEFLRSIAPYERAVAIDSAWLVTGGGPCAGCEALAGMVGSYQALDSLPAAERAARRWLRLQPRSIAAHATLADVLAVQERFPEALAVLDAAAAIDPTAPFVPIWRARVLIRAGRGGEAERLLAPLAAGRAENERGAVWHLALATREQGRLDEALAHARRFRELDSDHAQGDAAPASAALEGAIRLDRGEFARAAAIFDSVSRWRYPDLSPDPDASRYWRVQLAHVATALALAGDTARLVRVADSIAAPWPTGGRRERLLAHYARGLVLAARGRWPEAEGELRRAVFSPTQGYTRVNTALADALARQGRTAEARALLEAALRAPLDSRGLYVSRRELRRRLEALGT